MKTLLFHAIQPASHQPQLDWANFLRDASFLKLPDGSEQLARNVWLLPDELNACQDLARLGRQHAIATRVLAIVHSSNWQPLSPPA